MSDIGFSDQVPSLPDGGGGVQGIGATFTPDLSTGTGNLSIPIDIPNGPNDIGPRLTLQYSTASGNGPFGLGFSLSLVRLSIYTEYGFPQYDETDTLQLDGAGPLLAIGGGSYRPQTDGGAFRIQSSGQGFRLTSRDGTYYTLGTGAGARLADPSNPAHIFAWYLEGIEDPLGYTATFTWKTDGGQLYPDTITYGAYQLVFSYESRGDAFRSGRSGFTITTALRCTQIELRLTGDAQPAVRRWAFAYQADPANGTSLLTTVTLIGVDESGNTLAAPAVQLGYSTFGEPQLLRLNGADGAALPPLELDAARRTDLIDWNADGLPDILQVGQGGQAWVWLNDGNASLRGPSSAGTLPTFANADAAVAFADMNGDGLADLIRFDLPMAGYVPRTEGAGFGFPVSWSQAPPQAPEDANVRVVDLNGDGIVDLLASSDYGLTLFYRDGANGWEATPQVVPAGTAPDVDLSDPHVFLADMTGDGSSDVVLVSGGGVTYWPYLGNGQWDAPVTMASPPVLPYNVLADRLFLTDIDGDGCADLLYLNTTSVTYWINRSGLSFSPPQTIDYVPAGAIGQPRLADMTGSGTAGLVWSSASPFGPGSQYFYLEFVGQTTPRLLTRVDNGIGAVTAIGYSTSALEAASATASGQPWSTSMSLVLPVVKTLSVTDTGTGNTRSTEFTYWNGRFDGVLREFAGFGQVDQRDIGDSTIPTLLTSSWFYVGVDPNQPTAPLNEDDRLRLRAIRGRLYKRERYGEDGSALQNNPYDRLDYNWDVVTQSTSGGAVYVPRMITFVKTDFERAATAARIVTTTNTGWDASGNVTGTTETATAPGSPATQTLRTATTYATDPAGRFISKAFRVQQLDGAGTVVGDEIMVYDGAAEGAVGSQGLVTKRSALALSDAVASAVYGTNTPDFASLHYYRRTDSNGWWIDQGKYVRTVVASGLHGTVTGPNGNTFAVTYDQNQTFPVAIVDPAGNTVTATYNYRVSRTATLTDASGETFTASFDALARLIARVEPGDTAALPTFGFSYDTSDLPASVLKSTRAVSGGADTVGVQTRYAGDNTLIEQREFDETGPIVTVSRVLNARGLVVRDHAAWRPSSSTYAVPDPSVPHTAYTYDALGRPLTCADPDGNVIAWAFGAGSVDTTDADGKVTNKLLDETGRISEVQEHLDGRTLTSTYIFDIKGNLTSHTDAKGNLVSMWYDSFGRVLRVQRPEQDSATVFDASGNPVEARTPTASVVVRSFDICNRPATVSAPGAASPLIRYTYQDAGSPPPPDAGLHTAGGRCVRIDDASGTSIFDYDVRGKLVVKRVTPTGAPQRVVTLAYRADGQLASVAYPAGNSGSLAVTYQYGKRGLLSAIPGAITSVEYDLQGHRTSVAYANGVTSSYAYDPAGRMTALNHAAGTSLLRGAALTWDPAGNLTAIASADSNVSATFAYDDLHRLIQATPGTGAARTYAYDDAGNLTQKSDVGTYAYGENGMPATCLTTAGMAKFTYTALGQMAETPWGAQAFDALGHLVSISGSTSASFTYNYSGARVSASFTSGGAISTRLTPDVLYAVENGTLVNYLSDGQRLFARDVDGGARTYLHEDHLGSIVLLTDASGNVADEIYYDPFGAVVARKSAGSTAPVGFAQGTWDTISGLLYLQERYYHPSFGRFVTSDPIVQNVYIPIAWNGYAYCADNPQSYVDPTGRAWWQILIAVVAVVALVALTIVTCGVAAPALAGGIVAITGASYAAALAGVYVAVGVGLIAGGVIGGLAAYKAGGSTGDVILGALVGSALGGWAALASTAASVSITGALVAAGAKGVGLLAADVLAGTVSGAVNGASMGLATGFAGGEGTLDATLKDLLFGALVGGLIGGALGGANYALTSSPPAAPNTDPGQSPTPLDPTLQNGLQNPDPSTTNSIPSAAWKAASPWAGYVGSTAFLKVIQAGFLPAATVLAADASSGIVVLGYLPGILQWAQQNNVSVTPGGTF